MVEWKKLGEVCKVHTGNQLNRADMLEYGPYPVVNGGREYSGYTDKKNETANSITISQGGESAGYVNWIDVDFWAGAHCYVVEDSEKVDKRYLYHVLKNKERDIQISKQGAGIPGLNRDTLYKQIIPIPFISEQTRIVGILDTFTSSIENLKEQIAQRRKQYEYYRDQLLDLEGKEGVEMKHICDVAKNFSGLTYKPENVSDEGTLVLRSSNIDEDVLAFNDNVFVQMVIPERAIVKENDILICVRNGSKRLVGKAAMITKKAEGMAFGAFMTILRSFDIDSKYLFYVWQSEKVKKQYKGDEAMPIAQITAKDFQRIIIPVPSLSEQQRIVSILDTFEASIQNLEAQLDQRQKQYEYYRNQLLTFE